MSISPPRAHGTCHDNRRAFGGLPCAPTLVYPACHMTRRALLLTLVLATTVGASLAGAADKPLHLVLTPSQKPTNLLAGGEQFAKALGELAGTPIRVTVASDYAAVIEALRNQTADLAFVHPAGYVRANRAAKAMILAKNQWHGKTTFSARFYVRKESGIKTLEDLRGKT